ncbi:hypothetical protein CIB48_g7255 [Xylaria polymorpha]|nr:hypothetical protein CIB48_g7255 [Xylaria polymorpha]
MLSDVTPSYARQEAGRAEQTSASDDTALPAIESVFVSRRSFLSGVETFLSHLAISACKHSATPPPPPPPPPPPRGQAFQRKTGLPQVL